MLRILILLLTTCPLFVQAQQDSVLVEVAPHARILKFSPLSLIDPVPSIQFAYEWQFAERMSLQHEAGYIKKVFSEGFSWGINHNNLRGIRLRNEFRYYLQSFESRLHGFYTGPELLFLHRRDTRNAEFGMDCSGPFECNFFRRMDYTYQKQVYALHLKIGYQELFLKRFAYDIYAGLGYRHVRVKEIGAPDSPAWRMWDGFDFSKNPGIYHYPSMSFGFKIGYILFHKEQEYLLKYTY